MSLRTCCWVPRCPFLEKRGKYKLLGGNTIIENWDSCKYPKTVLLLLKTLGSRRQIVELILDCRYSFKGRRWKRVSNQAKAFVEDLLVLDPDDRATADSASRSTWLNRRQLVTVRNPNQEETEKAQQSLFQYAGYSKLKKLVRHLFLRLRRLLKMRVETIILPWVESHTSV